MKTVAVSTQDGCVWTAVSNAAWITIAGGSNGTGSGTVTYSIAANTDTQRFSSLTIAGNTYNLAQLGIACTYTFNYPTSPITAAGGASNYSVTKSHPGCHLEERNFDSNVRGGFVEPNSGPPRGLYLRFFVSPTLGGSFGLGTPGGIIQFNLYQASGCVFTVNNTNQSFDGGGGTGVYQLTTTLPLNQCQSPGGAYGAGARTSDSWIVLDNSASVLTGVNYTVAPNNSTATRTGTIMFQTFYGYDPPDNHIQTITQSGIACVYSLSINAANVPAAASGGTFDMHAPSPCTWTITPQVDWITINLNQNANGSGTVGYLVAANPSGAARTGTINAQGQTFTVNQAGATPTPSPTPTCTYTLGTTSQTFTSSGGTGSIDVPTQNGCAWTATNSDQFLTLSNTSGTGNGTINFDVAANSTGTTRTTTITVQGQIFTVTQSGGKTRKRVRFF